MEFIRAWILNIVSIILIVSFIEIILPDNGMKKFIDLALGFIIILVVVTPIVKVINEDLDVEEAIYTYSNDINRYEYALNTDNVVSKQNQQLLEIYKGKVKEDIKYRVESSYEVEIEDVELDIETKNTEELGSIKAIKIVVKENQSESTTIPIVKIDISTEEESIENTIEENIKESIVADISSIYNLENKQIEVSE